MENTRDWAKSMYDTKNLDQHHHYDFTRKKLNFCVVDGKIMQLQDFSSKKLMEKLQRRLRELHFNPENKLDQNAVVDWVFSGDHDRMNEMAFGDAAKDIDFSKNADNSGLRRVGEIEQYTLAAYDLACEKFGEENVMGAFAHLDETTVHIHLPVIPVAMRKARGKKTAVYVNLENPDLKIMSKEYRNLSSAKRKEWVRKEEVEKEMCERVSYSGLVGENQEERSKWLVDFHTEFYEKVGKKYGLERGESWEELTEEERKNRRWKSSRQLENERRQLEKEVRKLGEDAEELLVEKSRLERQVGTGAKVAAFFGVGELAEIRSEVKAAKKKVEKAEMDKEKAEKALRAVNEAHAKELAAAKGKNWQEGYSAAIEDVKKETALVGKNTPKEIGEAVKASLSRQGRLQDQIKKLEAQVSVGKNANSAAEKKAENAVADTLQKVNKVMFRVGNGSFSENDLARCEDIEKTLGSSMPLNYIEAKNNLCRSIRAWAELKWDGKKSPDALALLKKLFIAMKEAFRKLLALVGSSPERQQAAIDDVRLQLKFSPGIEEHEWDEAVQQSAEEYIASYCRAEQHNVEESQVELSRSHGWLR